VWWLAGNIEKGLPAEYQRHDGECLQGSGVEIEQESAGRKARDTKQHKDAQDDTGCVHAPIFHTLGIGDGRTLSGDDDMATENRR
jgi:hypothetical protein